MNRIKDYLVRLVIGHYYTEKEVYAILFKMQYEMAQRIIGNRVDEKAILPVDFFAV